MWTDPAALLAGLRGRRRCWFPLEDRIPPSLRMSVRTGETTRDPAVVVAVLTALVGSADLAGLRAGRPAEPTGRVVFDALSRLGPVPATATATSPARIPRPPPPRARLLELLGAEPFRAR